MTSSNERIHFYVKDCGDAMEVFIDSFHLMYFPNYIMKNA